jgi:hypothetical protein
MGVFIPHHPLILPRGDKDGVALGALVGEGVDRVTVEKDFAVQLVDDFLPPAADLLLEVVPEGAFLHGGDAEELVADLDDFGVLGFLVLFVWWCFGVCMCVCV